MATANQQLSEYLEAVASRTPTPGGGSVAGVVAGLGAALGSMVLAYSQGRKDNDADTEAVLSAVQASLARLRGHFLTLADEDAAAYDQVRSTRALPKGTQEEADRRRSCLQESLVQAAQVPLRTATLCREGLESLAGLADRTNPHLVTDLGAAARLLLAAAEAAALNVRVNLRSLHAENQQGMGERLDSVLERCRSLASGLEARVEQSLKD